MKRETSEPQLAAMLIAPAAVIITAVAVYPIFDALRLSFYHIQLQFPEQGRPFAGLDNYISLLQQPRFWHSLGITGIFTAVTVFFELVLGMALALIMNRPSRLQGFTRSAALIPWAFTTVVSARMWQFMFDGRLGVINGVLQRLGLMSPNMPFLWLVNDWSALLCAIIADVWKTTPFMALLLMAGLQGIPKDVYEAGKIDGCTPTQMFWRITLPILKPTILVSLLFRTLDAFRVFDLIFVMTGGGPGGATETISYLTYIKLFRQFDFGAGSAMSVMTFLFVMAICFVYIRVLGAEVKA